MGLITGIAVTFTDRKPNYLLICENILILRRTNFCRHIYLYTSMYFISLSMSKNIKLFEYEHYAMYISSVLIGYMQMTEKIKFIYINQLNQLDYTANEMAFTIK